MLRKENKRVCLFLWNNFINDARVDRECRTLVDAGYDVTLICLSYIGDCLPRVCFKDGFRIIRIKTRALSKKTLIIKMLYYIVPLIKMAFLGRKMNSDIYHSNDLNTLLQGVLSSKFRWSNSKLIYDSHEVQTQRTGYNSWLVGKIEKYLIKFIDEMITTTQTRANYIASRYQISMPHVIHNFPLYYDVQNINPIDIHKVFRVEKGKRILLYQGGLQEGRGIRNIIQAMKKIENAVLIILGNGSLKCELKEFVNLNELGHKIKFMDAVPKEDLKRYTISADVGFQVIQNTCFNHYSALSNKLFEYMMAEVPVLTNKGIPEIERIVRKTKVGLSVDSENIESIICGINQLLNDSELYKQTKKNCRIYKKVYSWERESEAFISIYSEVNGY